jgi:hypothetical protein
VRSVTLLPQELASAQEGLGVLKLPSHDGVPLVQTQREVPVTANPLGVIGVHNGLGGGTNGDLLLKRGRATMLYRVSTLR